MLVHDQIPIEYLTLYKKDGKFYFALDEIILKILRYDILVDETKKKKSNETRRINNLKTKALADIKKDCKKMNQILNNNNENKIKLSKSIKKIKNVEYITIDVVFAILTSQKNFVLKELIEKKIGESEKFDTREQTIHESLIEKIEELSTEQQQIIFDQMLENKNLNTYPKFKTKYSEIKTKEYKKNRINVLNEIIRNICGGLDEDESRTPLKQAIMVVTPNTKAGDPKLIERLKQKNPLNQELKNVIQDFLIDNMPYVIEIIRENVNEINEPILHNILGIDFENDMNDKQLKMMIQLRIGRDKWNEFVYKKYKFLNKKLYQENLILNGHTLKIQYNEIIEKYEVKPSAGDKSGHANNIEKAIIEELNTDTIRSALKWKQIRKGNESKTILIYAVYTDGITITKTHESLLVSQMVNGNLTELTQEPLSLIPVVIAKGDDHKDNQQKHMKKQFTEMERLSHVGIIDPKSGEHFEIIFFQIEDRIALGASNGTKSVKSNRNGYWNDFHKNDLKNRDPTKTFLPITKDKNDLQKEYEEFLEQSKKKHSTNEFEEFLKDMETSTETEWITGCVLTLSSLWHVLIKPWQRILPLIVMTSMKLNGWSLEEIREIFRKLGLKAVSVIPCRKSSKLTNNIRGEENIWLCENSELLLNHLFPNEDHIELKLALNDLCNEAIKFNHYMNLKEKDYGDDENIEKITKEFTHSAISLQVLGENIFPGFTTSTLAYADSVLPMMFKLSASTFGSIPAMWESGGELGNKVIGQETHHTMGLGGSNPENMNKQIIQNRMALRKIYEQDNKNNTTERQKQKLKQKLKDEAKVNLNNAMDIEDSRNFETDEIQSEEENQIYDEEEEDDEDDEDVVTFTSSLSRTVKKIKCFDQNKKMMEFPSGKISLSKKPYGIYFHFDITDENEEQIKFRLLYKWINMKSIKKCKKIENIKAEKNMMFLCLQNLLPENLEEKDEDTNTWNLSNKFLFSRSITVVCFELKENAVEKIMERMNQCIPNVIILCFCINLCSCSNSAERR